ncbi:hypothetical protein TTHERM_00463400 (macronuclear) [Tetrahymena thermophila SB210]|uniref:Uncharacterized protein n=1 Tax=Tetrahymena thermophila (strain SB210) TaxID=312017 RepID=Q23PU3_TETTS|nr:hypothetical protein TTHERM_00463400 [Tetrahymena thermophila SB210]EAR98592.2 hypothetical protein TTHERM_00463400 [Tetrahymena thermophila SB210]|eukprot:XP_001018837.2 hypothetical protein TTHERM_00463400 [Tetrahymena thermophila SB210]
MSTFLSVVIIWQFLDYKYVWILFYLFCAQSSLDYLFQFTHRRQYYKKQKEKEWREIIQQIIPLKIIVSEFDYRTMRLNLFDCSTAAQSYIKQQEEDEDKYNKFLERVVLNIDTSKIKFKQFQEQENLKKYLTHRFIMVDDFIKKNEKKIMKNASNRIKVASQDIRKQFTFKQQETFQEKKLNTKIKSKLEVKRLTQLDQEAMELAQLDEMEGYYFFGETDQDIDPNKKKKIKIKVAYYSVQNTKPLLVISIEDESLREDIEFYKEEKQKSDQFIANMLENYRTTLINNLNYFNQGWLVVKANFEEIFRNSLILVNKCYAVYDYFLFLKIRRQFNGISHRQTMGLFKVEDFNFVDTLKYLIDIFHNIDIVCELDNDTSICNDQKRIKQVLISLITNCLKITISAISINIYESYLDDIQVIFVRFAFYKEEDNNLEGILDHLDGTDSPYVNQIEQIVLQEIIRCIGPFELKAQVSPSGFCEIEFAIYGDLARFKRIFQIQDFDEDMISKQQNLELKAKQTFKAEHFQRKNKRQNKTFYDLKNFNQMESIVGIPRGSKLISKEVKNQLQAFLTLKDQKCNSEDDSQDQEEGEEKQQSSSTSSIQDEGTTKIDNKQEQGSSEKAIQKLCTVTQNEEEEDDDEKVDNVENLDQQQYNHQATKSKNLEQQDSQSVKAIDYENESIKSSNQKKRQINNHFIDEFKKSKEITLARLNTQTQSQNGYITLSNDTSSFGSKKQLQNNSTLKHSKDAMPFIPKKFTSSFTTLRQSTVEEVDISDKRHHSRQHSRNKSQKNNYLQDSQRSISQLNGSYNLYTETLRGDRSNKGNYLESSQNSIYDCHIKSRDDKQGFNSSNKFDHSSRTIQIENDDEEKDLNACNLTFQIDKSDFEINDFIPRLR